MVKEKDDTVQPKVFSSVFYVWSTRVVFSPILRTFIQFNSMSSLGKQDQKYVIMKYILILNRKYYNVKSNGAQMIVWTA